MSTYKRLRIVIGITAIGSALFGALLLLTPASVHAFWPFASAQAADGDAPIVHDASMRLLAAALNTEPASTDGLDGLTLTDDSALVATASFDGSNGSDESHVTSSDSLASSGDGSISVYTVKDGDSISSIADHFGISVNTILWANDLTVRSTIRPGISLIILPVSGVKHTVGKGETLSSIAAAYHASAGEIATFNGLDANATVVVGSTLIIPGGAENASSTPKPAAKAAAKTTSVKSSTKTSTAKVRADLGTADSSGYFENPVPGAILTQGIHGNNAVDLGAPSGTPIHAAAAGTVIISKSDGAWNGGYGSYVVVSHANGEQTLYAHMSQDIVSVGEQVSQGEVIGYVGETGEATGNHLHFEVRSGKNPFGYSCTLMKKCY